MNYGRIFRGPLKLFALPGAEEYVAKVAKWLAKNYLKEIGESPTSLVNFFNMDEDEAKFMDSFEGTKEEFLQQYLVGSFNYFTHRNGAIEISITKSCRGKDVYLFHTFSETDIVDYNKNPKRLNLSDQEVLLYNALDAFSEAKVGYITLIEMNLGQARSDRPKGRGACNLRTFFRNITANGCNHFVVYQIHSAKSLIGLDSTKIFYDNLRGENLLKKYILRSYVKKLETFNTLVANEWVFSSVDAGGKEFAAQFSKVFKAPLLVVDKRRNSLTNNIDEITILKPENLSLEGKIIYIVDDMIDSGGSILDVCRKYKELGAKEVNVVAFYGLFSHPAEERLSKLYNDGIINKIIITDLVTHDKEFYERNPYIVVSDTSYTTARVIQKTNNGGSLEKYFTGLNAENYLKKIESNRFLNFSSDDGD